VRRSISGLSLFIDVGTQVTVHKYDTFGIVEERDIHNLHLESEFAAETGSAYLRSIAWGGFLLSATSCEARIDLA
jgi:hypothetical protein